ncbi:hypothetical protein D9M71_530100 [compost metagenome]
MFTITPRSSSPASTVFLLIASAAKRSMLNVPVTLICRVFENSPKSCTPSRPTTLAEGPIPAQLTKPCKRPCLTNTSLKNCSAAASSVTSSFTKSAFGPNSFTCCSPASTFMSTNVTEAPCFTKYSAVAAPKPEPPPVITKCFPWIFIM